MPYQVNDEPIPGYHLIKFLGRGNFGEVWEAKSPGGIHVALKVISLGRREGYKEFKSLQLFKSIHYPNLTPITAFWLKGEDGELLEESQADITAIAAADTKASPLQDTIVVDYTNRAQATELIIAMGLGEISLADRLEQCLEQGLGGIPLDELLDYMDAAARAIDFLNSPRHNLGRGPVSPIQHCDIKPQNMLLVGGAIQVCDFGLARELNPNIKMTSAAATPAYGAPELLDGQPPSPTTDQYSLAISYVELRTGQLPFPTGATAHTVIVAHLNSNLDLSRVPEAEREVIRRATSRKPEDRYPSALAMVQALRQAISPQPVVAPLQASTGRRVLLGIGAACLVLAAAAVAGFALRPPAAGPPKLSKLELPTGFVAAPDAKWVTVNGREWPEAIVCQRHELNVPFRLVNGRRTRPFYLMENKVTNAQFARFAAENAGAVKETWREGACADRKNLGVDGHENLPVYRVSCVEAARFARWLGGALPSVEQWDEAAGRFSAPREQADAQQGPFQPLDPQKPVDEQVAVDRGVKGPLPAGAATRDVSPWGCRDMAGNGSEWTASPRDATERFDPDRPDELLSMVLRGRSYLQPTPLTFSELDDRSFDESWRATESNCDIGFRAAVSVED